MRQGTGELDVKDVREVNGADGRQKRARAFLRTSTANYVTDRAFHAGVISDVTLEATPRSSISVTLLCRESIQNQTYTW